MQPYRQAVVVGLGASGVAAARLLRAEGTRVTALDAADTPELQQQARALEAEGVVVGLGAQALPADAFEVAVVSPGVPLSAPLLQAARRRGLPLLAELELGWSRHAGRTVAVTGSNGKSTMVKWLAEAFAAAGCRSAPAGNFGPPVSQVVRAQPDLDWLVLEVSTFQLETVQAFRAEVAVLLNIFSNHLDRHGDLATYTALKARIFAHSRPGDVGLTPVEWQAPMRRLSGGAGVWRSFGAEAAADYRFAQGQVWRAGRVVADLRATPFDNAVLGPQAAAGVAVLEAAGVGAAPAEQAARRFVPLPHRMQLVAERAGVRYVNDSKATNLTAMAAALRMTPGPVRLIAGGLVKEKDLTFVKEVLAQKATGVYLIGRATEDMASAWTDVVPCHRCGTLDRAVRQARADARAGETVLLSPACASFDQFRNFEERGAAFARLVTGPAGEDFE